MEYLEIYLKDLGSRISKARKERKMSQQRLAQAAQLDRAYISTVENGKQNVTVFAVMRIALALDLSFKELIVE